MSEDSKKLNVQLDIENSEELKSILAEVGSIKLVSKVVNALLKNIPRDKKLNIVKNMTIEDRIKDALKNPDIKKEIEEILRKSKD